jgi:hypothetical protein
MRRFARVARFALCPAALALASCMQPSNGAHVPGLVGASKTFAHQHLYVADPGSGAIYRYALIDGLPQTTPDKTFASLTNPSRLGVDASGNIYAQTPNTVYKFSKDGTVLGYFTITTPGAFAVDFEGYTYIGAYAGSQIAVYAPQAYKMHGMVNPIATLTATGGNYNQIVDLATDDKPRLYASAWQGIDIWNHPHQTSPHQSLSILHPLPKINNDAVFNEAMAFDENHRLYAGVGYLSYCGRCKQQYWEDTDFDAISGWLRPGRKDQMILAGECVDSYSTYMFGGMVTGMDVKDGYLEAACTGDTTAVWVYRADQFARQHAVETLEGLTSPSDAKVGP